MQEICKGGTNPRFFKDLLFSMYMVRVAIADGVKGLRERSSFVMLFEFRTKSGTVCRWQSIKITSGSLERSMSFEFEVKLPR